MEIEITQEEYEKYLKNKNIDKNIKSRFKIGDAVFLAKDELKDIYIIDFCYRHTESYNRKTDNELSYITITYYIIHNKNTNIKYTVTDTDIKPYKSPIIYSSDNNYKKAISNKYDK